MCIDICTINIRVSIRVRGLHLVFIFLPLYTFKVNLKFMGFPKGRHAIIGRVCGVASEDPRCTSGVAQYGKLRIYNRVGYRIAVGHTMNSKGARSSVNVECDVVRA